MIQKTIITTPTKTTAIIHGISSFAELLVELLATVVDSVVICGARGMSDVRRVCGRGVCFDVAIGSAGVVAEVDKSFSADVSGAIVLAGDSTVEASSTVVVCNGSSPVVGAASLVAGTSSLDAGATSLVTGAASLVAGEPFFHPISRHV